MTEMKNGLKVLAEKENDAVQNFVRLDYGKGSNVQTINVNNNRYKVSIEVTSRETTATKYMRPKNSDSWGVSSNRTFKPYQKCNPKIREFLKNYKRQPIRFKIISKTGSWKEASLMPDGEVIYTATSEDTNIEKNEIVNEPKDDPMEQLENVVKQTELMNINENESISEDQDQDVGIHADSICDLSTLNNLSNIVQ